MISKRKCSRFSVSGLNFSLVFGMKYSLPGSTSRTELTCAEICLILSMILSFSSQKIMLLCFPITSMIRDFLHKSPKSSKCSISKRTIRSISGWKIFVIRPFAICLRKSIQKFGAFIGLGLFVSVRYINGRDAEAESRRRACPMFPPLIVKISSSFSGCAIFAMRPFKMVRFKSYTIFAMVIPSNAMVSYLLPS